LEIHQKARVETDAMVEVQASWLDSVDEIACSTGVDDEAVELGS